MRRSLLRSRFKSLFVALSAMATFSIVHLTTFDSGTAHAVTGPTVSSVITTPERTQLLSAGPNVVFDSAAPAPANIITVDPNQTFQTMDGFGASITDSSAGLLYTLPQAQRDGVMNSIFHPVTGIGMSFLRQPIGASDFVDEPHYTYNDGTTDLNQTRFSIAHDNAQILPLLRQARTFNPALKVIGSPWSAPAWMKANNSLVGGQMRNDPAYFQSYALYLLKFVQAYEVAGVPIYAITPQNEPQNRTPGNYPGTDMPVAHQNAVIAALGPLLASNGLSRVKIISFDHNWSLHPDDLADANAMGLAPEPDYPFDALRASAAQYIAGTGFHHYSGTAARQNDLHNAFPSKDIWLTEASGWRGAADSVEKVFADTFNWHSRNVYIASVRNWAKAVVNWNLALNPAGGPVRGGCGTDPASGACTAVITINGTTVTRNAEYYIIGHFSKYVKAGAVRIGSNNVGSLENVAFRNPDGSFALVVKNVSAAALAFAVSWNGMRAPYTIPANALMTLTWSGTVTTPTIDPTRWYQVISTNSNKCLDANGAGTANGTLLIQWACAAPASNNQQWQFRVTSGGYYQVVPRHASTLAWDVSGGTGATGDGVNVNLWTYGGGTNQQWQPVALGGGNYRFVARHSGKCLDVRGVSTADGAQLQQWTCTGGVAQSFRLVLMP